MRQAFFAGLLIVGLYFVFDPATPELYQLLISFGLLGLLLYYFLGGGGCKDDGLKNEENSEYEDMHIRSPRLPRASEHSEPSEYED